MAETQLGYTPLLVAVQQQQGRTDLLEVLLGGGADVDAAETTCGCVTRHTCFGNSSILRTLLG